MSATATLVKDEAEIIENVAKEFEAESASRKANGKASKPAHKATEVPSQVTPDDASQEAALSHKKEALAALEASRDKAARSIGGFQDSTALGMYVAIGEDCFDPIYRQYMIHASGCEERKVPNSYKDSDYDNEINVLTTRVETLYPHLFYSKEDDDASKGRKGVKAHVANYVLVFLTVRAIKTALPYLAEMIDRLSYFLVINQIARKCVSFSKTSLTCDVRPEWSEWLKVNVPRIANGEITSGDFIALIGQHVNALKNAKFQEANAGKTPDQLAALAKDEAVKEAARKKMEAANKANTNLATALDTALSGLLDSSVVGAIIQTVAKDRKVDLSSLGIPSAKSDSKPNGFDPATVTSEQILDLYRDMWLHKRFDVLRAVHEASAAMVAMLDTFPKAAKAAG